MLVPPSPNVQAQEVGLFVELSVKVTVWLAVGVVGEQLKPATGAAALTMTDLLTVLDPLVLAALRVTLKVPATA